MTIGGNLANSGKLNGITRVLIADDSAYVRKVVREMLAGVPVIEVVGAARDGVEALRLSNELQPDVVISDLMMPELDGVGFVKEQMSRRPLPILVMSSMGEHDEETLAALDAGAVDFIQKPTALATEKIYSMRENLVEKIKAAAISRPHALPDPVLADPIPQRSVESRPGQAGRFDVIVIGISTGGPQALRAFIPRLPAEFPVPIAIVMHMPVGYTKMYAERLNDISAIDFIESSGGEELRPGAAFLAPGGKHLLLKRAADGTVRTELSLRPLETPHRPSVDVLFQSAANSFEDRVLGVVMTGMGSDGREGSAWIKARGGVVYTEAEQSCIVYGMPSTVFEAGLSDRQVDLAAMAETLVEIS